MNRIIIPTGYMGSGSSALTDILSEIDGFSAPNATFEYIFMHCPDGLFDLEDKLLLGNNVLRSDEAIYRFLSMMKSLYNTRFFWPGSYQNLVSKSFYDHSVSFIKEITTVSFNESYWYFQELPQTVRMKILLFLKALILKVYPCQYLELKRPLLYKTINTAFPSSNVYYESAKKYLNNIFSDLGIEKMDLILDQLVLPHNLFRIKNYFNQNARVIVIDRDPRDVFILNKYVWSKKGGVIPYPFDAEKFVLYYKSMRQSEHPTTDSRILRLHFEDLIYQYDECLNLLYKFLDISPEYHTRKFSRFNPKISIKNTHTYVSNEVLENEISIIENNLKEYLYPFPQNCNSTHSLKDSF